MKISLLFLLICVAAATATEVEQPEQDIALPVETSFDDIEPVSEQEYNEDDDELPADEDDDDELNKDMESKRRIRLSRFCRRIRHLRSLRPRRLLQRVLRFCFVRRFRNYHRFQFPH